MLLFRLKLRPLKRKSGKSQVQDMCHFFFYHNYHFELNVSHIDITNLLIIWEKIIHLSKSPIFSNNVSLFSNFNKIIVNKNTLMVKC